MDIRKIQKIDRLIRSKQTGTPKEFAKKLACSERTIFHYIAFIKERLNAPIVYNINNESYMYEIDGKLGLETYEVKK